jgi:hypothetical protein
VTQDDFRRIALSMPEAIESSHMGHPDFRVAGKIFATLGAPALEGALTTAWGNVAPKALRDRKTIAE